MNTFARYLNLYGGVRELITSKYLYMALVLTLVTYPIWSQMKNGEYIWPQITIDIVPSLLGFSMGGMAIMLAFSGAKFFRIIAEDGDPRSLFVKVIASFFHFILVQTIAIMFALLTFSFNFLLLSALGFLSLIYSLMVAVATAGQLLQVATIMNATASLNDESCDCKKCCRVAEENIKLTSPTLPSPPAR